MNDYYNFKCFLSTLRHPTYTKDGKDFQWSLDNMYRLDEYMGFPSKKLRYIHVAGTNGKGSTVSYLAAIFMRAGYKVGYYRSPQMFDISERFYINDKMITQDEILEFYHKVCQYLEYYGASERDTKGLLVSYSELFISLAFYYFASNEVDIVVLETGIGGLNDPTNIIEKPELCIITSIGYDHINLLGNTLTEIAYQKSGIIKENVPVLLGHIDDIEVQKIIRKESVNKQSKLFLVDEFYNKLNNEEQILCEETGDVIGDYQKYNLQTVSCALKILKKTWKISLSFQDMLLTIQNAMQVTGLYGRWQIVNESPKIIMDVADNPMGLRVNFLQLERILSLYHYEKLVLIITITSEKKLSIKNYLPKHATYIITESRGYLTPKQIAEGLGVEGYLATSVQDAINYYKKISSDKDLVYVGGSHYVVEEALQSFKQF